MLSDAESLHQVATEKRWKRIMQIEPFVMERWQSTHEHQVELNLSDSGVNPLTVSELLEPGEFEEMLAQKLIYTQSNGSPELRDRIAALYPGANRENIEVTNGGSEANLISAWSIVEPGDEVVVQIPNYMQLWGVTRALGADTKAWELRPDLDGGRWELDFDELEAMVGPKTRMIALCNPNNPAGSIMNESELDRVAEIAARHGTWVLVDEIYHGAELDGSKTPSMWGRHDRVIVTNSLSKAYGLPGLRLGWILGPPETIDRCWGRHDYTSIAPGALSDLLAEKALQPERRARILERTRSLLTSNLQLALDWVDRHPQIRTIKPRGGAYLMLAYDNPINSSELAEKLRVEKSMLLVPGDHFGMDQWVRVGFGDDTETLTAGLQRFDELLVELGDQVPG